MTIEQAKKLKAMVVEVELIKNEEAFSEKDIKEIAEGQEKIIKKQDELIDYMLSLLQCWWMWATLMSVPKRGEEMVYRFNKENFNKNASKNVKEKIKYILDEIENKEVEFDENNNGTIKIDWYGVEHELYPVQKSWCIETDI